jgi:EmrB/QacA subfamily drug resistance transporter
MAKAPFSASGRWVLAATILGSSMAFIDGSVVSVALPVLQEDFGTTASNAQWIVEAYQLFLASLVLVGGSLADRYGRKRIFTIGTIAFAGASLACGLAPNTLALIAARAAQGIGGALLVPSSLALLGSAFPPDERGRAVGTWAALTGIAGAIGPALGGWLVQAVSWRAVFLVNLPIAAAVLWIALRKVRESRNPAAGPLDLAGAGLATFGFGAIVYGLIEGPTLGWAHATGWGAIAAGLIGLVALTVVENRVAHPMVPLRLFRNRTFTAANLLTFFLYAALAVTFFFIPFVLIQARGYTPAQAGTAILPLVLIIAALSRAAGALADRIGARLPLTVGPLVCGAGFLLLGLLPPSGSYAATMLPALSVLGLGMAIAIAPLTATVLNGVPGKDQGAASGISNAVARVAGLLAIAAFGILASSSFNRTLDQGLDAARVSSATRARLAPERAKLGATKPPAGASAAEAEAIQAAVKKALNGAFRVVSIGCAGLALLSAACAAVGVSGVPGSGGGRARRKA